jgi:hypothetical protein
MIDHQKDIVTACLSGASDGSLSFEQITTALGGQGFESLFVDFRRSAATFYPDGDGAVLVVRLKPLRVLVAGVFDEKGIQAANGRTNRSSHRYSCLEWWNDLAEAGCAGFIAAFSARRALYFGRCAEVLVGH